MSEISGLNIKYIIIDEDIYIYYNIVIFIRRYLIRPIIYEYDVRQVALF